MPSRKQISRRRPSLREWPTNAGRGTSGPFRPSLNPRPGVLWAPPGCTYVQRGASVVSMGSYGPRRGGSKYAPLRLIYEYPHMRSAVIYLDYRSHLRFVEVKAPRPRAAGRPGRRRPCRPPPPSRTSLRLTAYPGSPSPWLSRPKTVTQLTLR